MLAPDGVLFVGPAEAFLTRSSGFRSADFPSSFACRRTPRNAAAPPLPWAPPEIKFKTPLARRAEAPQKKLSTPAKAKIDSAPAAKAPDGLEAAGRLADAGRVEEAGAACEAHLREHGPSTAGLYLLAVIRDTLGDSQGATEYYRKVLYLDPDHPEALLHLALTAEKRGDRDGARRLQLRARRNEEATSR